MKKLQLLAFLFLALATFTFSSCGNDDDKDSGPSQRALLTGGQWTGQQILFDGVDYTDTLAEYQIPVSSFKVKFNEDGTGTSTFIGQGSSGKWEFADNEKAIVFDKGTSDETKAAIKKLTSSELYLEMSADDTFDDPGDVQKVEIRFSR